MRSRQNDRMRKLTTLFLLCFVVTGCSRVELASHFVKKGMDYADNSKSMGHYKVGSPYIIKGKKYYPKVDYRYNQKGIASWYGPGFHGKSTANGERYDQNDLTAAHKTLPLPSIVRVTNLENGRSVIVRVNDRGPYAHGRIIDMSKRGAEVLGFKNNGIANVRVQVLEAESRHVAELAKTGKSTRGIEVAMNKKSYKPPKINAPTQAFEEPEPVYQQASVSVQSETLTEPAVRKAGTTAFSGHKTFVQTGAFSTRDAAMRYSSSLSDYGRAQIFTTEQDGRTLYRVRFPSLNIQAANNLVARLNADGYQNAIIVVD